MTLTRAFAGEPLLVQFLCHRIMRRWLHCLSSLLSKRARRRFDSNGDVLSQMTVRVEGLGCCGASPREVMVPSRQYSATETLL